MAKTKYSARINGEHIDGTIEIIKRIVLHLHDMGKTQFKVKDVDEQIEELKNQWQITPFRQKLLELYSSCPLTDLDVRSLLIASHIKPWSKCNNEERLDPFNGLMLAPNIDALFDSGLITFDADGTIKISPKIDLENQKRLGISPDMKLKIEPESQKYFEYHRNHVFQREE